MVWRLDSADTTVGSVIRVGVYAVASGQVDDPPNEPFSFVGLVFTWDPAVLRFAGHDESESPVTWLVAGMPDDRDRDGLNSSFADGDAYFNAVRNLFQIPEATPDGILVSHLQFEVLSPSAATTLRMHRTYGALSQTEVFDDQAPTNILGSIDSITISVGGACEGDLNGDGVVDLGDLSALLSNFGMSGASPADGDLNGDGVVDLGDLSRLLSLFGTNCP